MKVLEKFKNKKVFAMYLLGVLLLSTGVSYAYFTLRTTTSGNGTIATGVTTTIEADGLASEGNIDFNNTSMYPGHMGISSIKVTGRGNNIPLIYNVIFEGTNTFNTPINYTVYKTTENIEASYTCQVQEEIQESIKILYEECTGNNIDELGEPISTGTIQNGTGVTTLKSDEILLTTEEGNVVYYYVVFEYPNLDESQNDDMGSSISGVINITEGNEYQNPNINFTSTTVSGSNGWYTSASITTNISTQTGNYDASYCITTENSCTPNIDASITNNSFSVNLTSNAQAQKVCVRVEDEYQQVMEGCSNSYLVDGTVPTSSTSIASSTTGSNNWYQGLSISATGNDTHSGISSILYCTTTSSTCTPTTEVSGNISLSSNSSAQRVCTQSVDNAGNRSSISCSSSYLVDTTNPSGSVSIASSISGSNSWYRALTLRVNGSDSHSGVSNIRYCTTTSSSCTPSTSVSGSSANVTMGSNASAQRVCYQVTDNSGRTSSIACSGTYSVDTTNPTVSIASTSVTENTIRVTVTGSDSHSGIYQYRFSSNGGSSYTTVSSTSSSYTYTFSNLNSGTSYNIAVQSVDRSGRVSSTASRSVTTEEPPTAAETILAGRTVQTRTFPITTSTTVTGTNGYGDIYRAEDDDGTTYYFAGNPATNWVYFAGYYWRIIRINGDGSIRMIYNGTNVATTGEDLHIGLVVFNESDGGSVNVGLKYGTTQHGTTTNSTILKSLNTWYSNNIQNTQYEQYISTEAGFCGDREMASGYTWSATIYGSAIYYASYDRLILNINNVNPTFKCSNNSDLYTVSSANKGNKALTYPIGLITADEAVYAGLNQIAGIKNNYLYTGNDYWTMTPVRYYRSGSGDHATVFLIGENSMMGDTRVNLHRPYARPVINLRADITLTGSGTTTDPYVVS